MGKVLPCQAFRDLNLCVLGSHERISGQGTAMIGFFFLSNLTLLCRVQNRGKRQGTHSCQMLLSP